MIGASHEDDAGCQADCCQGVGWHFLSVIPCVDHYASLVFYAIRSQKGYGFLDLTDNLTPCISPQVYGMT